MQWHGQLETESFYEYSLLQPDDPVSASTNMFDDGDYLVLAKREEPDGQPVAGPPEIQTPLSRK